MLLGPAEHMLFMGSTKFPDENEVPYALPVSLFA
jgi:secreted Zn-dependent insulinase-like peptidase